MRRARRQYRRKIARHSSRRLKFIDETGCNIAMMRRGSRATPGVRVKDAVPKSFGRNVTVLGALSCQGLEAVMTIDSATGATVFRTYVNHVLIPTLRPGDVVVMDNLSAHKVAGIEQTIEGVGATLIYLPPYSPEFSTIENCWSKLKTKLRSAKARTRQALDEALRAAIDSTSAADAQGWLSIAVIPYIDVKRDVKSSKGWP